MEWGYVIVGVKHGCGVVLQHVVIDEAAHKELLVCSMGLSTQ